MYVRKSTITVAPEQFEDALRVSHELADWYRKQNGHRFTLVLEPRTRDNEITRITAWEDRESADQVSQQFHTHVLRSQLLTLSVDGQAEDDSFEEAVTALAVAG